MVFPNEKIIYEVPIYSMPEKEFKRRWDNWLPLPRHFAVQLPIQLSYTYTNTEMKKDFISSAWGNVVYGDEIPYIYKHAFNAQIGIEHKWVGFLLYQL